jgi:hypothetical protein
MDRLNLELLIRIEELIRKYGLDRVTATEIAMIEFGLNEGDVLPPPPEFTIPEKSKQ